MFRVAPGFGFLGSKEARTVQVSFTPRYVRALAPVSVNELSLRLVLGVYGLCCSGEREFRAALVILSPLVKTTLTLQLQGTGSFNEVHRKDNLA